MIPDDVIDVMAECVNAARKATHAAWKVNKEGNGISFDEIAVAAAFAAAASEGWVLVRADDLRAIASPGLNDVGVVLRARQAISAALSGDA